MHSYPRAAVERMMKIQEVILRAMAKKITWWQAAEIIGISDRSMRLNVITGTVPNLLRLQPGCRFAPRCPHAMPICREREPELLTQDKSKVACWLYEPGPGEPSGQV